MADENTWQTGLLSRDDIEKFNLIEDADPKCLQAASYDLRLGDRHYVYEGSKEWKAVFLGTAEELKNENLGLPADSALTLQPSRRGGDILVIPPFGSAIIQLQETVNLLYAAKEKGLLITGRFDLKLKQIYKGLVSQQATQVEPCYRGKLYCFLYNLGSQEVVLTRGETIATIEFSFAGQGLDRKQREEIIKTTRERNKKYSGPYAYEKDGIRDIRWLHQQKMLPEECGIAPIHQLVNGNVKNAVEAHLDKFDTVDHMTERIGSKLEERQNSIKLVISLVVAVVVFFTASYLIEIKAELRYFREEFAFLTDSMAGEIDESALQAMRDHTDKIARMENLSLWLTLVFVGLVVAGMFVLLFRHLRPTEEQTWIQKQKALEAQEAYLKAKKKLEESQDKAEKQAQKRSR